MMRAAVVAFLMAIGVGCAHMTVSERAAQADGSAIVELVFRDLVQRKAALDPVVSDRARSYPICVLSDPGDSYHPRDDARSCRYDTTSEECQRLRSALLVHRSKAVHVAW